MGAPSFGNYKTFDDLYKGFGTTAFVGKEFTAEEKVSKLNFLEEDVENKIASVEPGKIVGAEMAFFFNTKTNQLSYYHAMDRGGLDVKGTSIYNFDD